MSSPLSETDTEGYDAFRKEIQEHEYAEAEKARVREENAKKRLEKRFEKVVDKKLDLASGCVMYKVKWEGGVEDTWEYEDEDNVDGVAEFNRNDPDGQPLDLDTVYRSSAYARAWKISRTAVIAELYKDIGPDSDHTQTKLKVSTFTEVRNDMLPILASLDDEVYKALLQGNLSRARYLSKELDHKLKQLATNYAALRINSADLRPSQFICELVDDKGRAMKKNNGRALLEDMALYRDNWEFAAQIDDVLVEVPAGGLGPAPKNLDADEDSQGALTDEQWYKKWESEQLEKIELNSTDYQNGLRKWLENGLDEPLDRLEEFLGASERYLDLINDNEDYMPHPFNEQGYANEPVQRQRRNVQGESTNWLVELADAICRVKYDSFWRIRGHTIFHSFRREHGSDGEILFTTITGANHKSGHGFSHSPPGITTTSSFTTPGYDMAVVWDYWAYYTEKHTKVIENLEAEAVLCQNAFDQLLTAEQQRKDLQQSIDDAELEIARERQKRLEAEIKALTTIVEATRSMPVKCSAVDNQTTDVTDDHSLSAIKAKDFGEQSMSDQHLTALAVEDKDDDMYNHDVSVATSVQTGQFLQQVINRMRQVRENTILYEAALSEVKQYSQAARPGTNISGQQFEAEVKRYEADLLLKQEGEGSAHSIRLLGDDTESDDDL